MTKNNGFITKFKTSIFNPKSKNMEQRKFDFVNQLVWIVPGLFFIFIFMYYAIYIVFRDGFNFNGGQEQFQFSFRFFKMIFEDENFVIAIKNSIIYVFVSIPIALIISLLTAKCISNILNKRCFSFVQSIFFLPYVTSSLAIAMAFSMMFSSNSTSLLNSILNTFKIKAINWSEPKNARLLLIIFGVWKMLPFKIIMFTAAFMNVDKKLYWAASIDGASKPKQFFKISLPQIMPIIIFMITTGVITAFKFMPLGLYSNYQAAQAAGAQTVVYYIFNVVSYNGNYGKAGAASIVLMAIILVISVMNMFLTKFLRKKY